MKKNKESQSVLKNEQNENKLTKQWWKSKTVWFNVLTGITLIANMFLGYTGEFSSPEVAKNFETILTAIAVIGNLFLRKQTKTAIALK